MQSFSTINLIISRLRSDWKLLLSIFFGFTVATSLITGAPIYIRTLERQGIDTAIDRAASLFLNIFIYAPHVPLSRPSIEGADQALDGAVGLHLSDIYGGQENFFRAPTYLAGLPGQDLPETDGDQGSQGYLQYFSNIERHVDFLEGRMATDVVVAGESGPLVEAIVGERLATLFQLTVGDVVTLTPDLGKPVHVFTKIVGIVEATDPVEDYWQQDANSFLAPASSGEVVDRRVVVDPDEPPLSMFVTRDVLIEGVGATYPGTMVSSIWFVSVEKEKLKNWSMAETRGHLGDLEADVASAFQGSAVLTGIEKLLDDFERKSFFSSVPIVLLLAIMVITALYYLAMMISYLVQSREGDVALLRSRGVSTLQLLRLYALEGLALTVVAVAVAPFLAMGATAIAGKLPYFREITGGAMLPVEFHWSPFLVAAGGGLLGLAIFIIPGVFSARTGLVAHKLRSSRPPSIPFFQRYYIDIGLLLLGGLVYWELRELHERGQVISAGLFTDLQVNEVLLLSPVLFLTVVALLFMRFFPLVIRFISGESAALLHLAGAAALGTLASFIVARDVIDDNGLDWLVSVLILAALGLAYWRTQRRGEFRSQIGGLLLQAALVAALILLEPPTVGDISFVPTISVIVLVPAQLLFSLLTVATRIAPVWASLGLWHMARNPLQYSWLVLLLVMVTGLGVLTTTVGGTLSRSHEERILYDTAADVRISNIPDFMARGGVDILKRRYLTIPGVTTVSLALRDQGRVGAGFSGSPFNLLAVEPGDFPYMSWYRDDFSDRPLSGLMQSLQSNVRTSPVNIPEGATEIGLWAKPLDEYPGMFVWMVLQDGRGTVETVSLGRLGPAQWHRLTAEIPFYLRAPLQLVSVQIFEPVQGPQGTPGTILFDDIHATMGTSGETRALDDFEGGIRWTPLASSLLSSDSVGAILGDVHGGNLAGRFSFGKDTDRGIRGFYVSPNGGPMPIVASSSFMSTSGAAIGDVRIVSIRGRFVPVVIRDTVDYFPTLNPINNGFILVDLKGLLRQLNILSPTSTITPNELFISEAPGAGEAVHQAALLISGSPDSVHDRQSQLAAIRLDPMVTAGWKAMVLLSLGIIVFTAGFGYLTYMLSFADRGRSEIGLLRSMGLSRRQVMGLLSLEHFVIGVMGLGLGTWAGFQMSTLMVSSIAVTDSGQRVVPPFILTTDWNYMLLIYAALAAIFLAALFRLTRSMMRLDLYTISRTEGK